MSLPYSLIMPWYCLPSHVLYLAPLTLLSLPLQHFLPFLPFSLIILCSGMFVYLLTDSMSLDSCLQ